MSDNSCPLCGKDVCPHGNFYWSNNVKHCNLCGQAPAEIYGLPMRDGKVDWTSQINRQVCKECHDEHPAPKIVTLTFHPASEPPDDDRTVLCCDGNLVMEGWYDEYASGGPRWYSVSGDEWDGIKSWADLPKAGECVE